MATSQDIIAFKTQMPVFASARDADIAAVLNTAAFMVPNDGTYDSLSYPRAMRLYAAWLLDLMQQQEANASLSGQEGESSSTPLDTVVSSITFGERTVSFAQRGLISSNSAAETLGPGEALFNANIWGVMYLQLRSRNVVPVMVV